MAGIFLSHSSKNNAAAIALRKWIIDGGWDDHPFLDLDPERGIAAGERWERALYEAADRCEAVLFLVSRDWLKSDWCVKEFNLAQKLNKRLFGVLIHDLPKSDLPSNLTTTWQMVNLASGNDHIRFRTELPDLSREEHVTFSRSGLARLKTGLDRAGLDPRFFAWPPENEPDRAPYPGLRPLEAEDAGIFFGREAPTVVAFDRLRGLREAAPPRLLVILGASGAGKSSFLRAGLIPRLARDDANFLPLPNIRPETTVITGKSGLIHSLQEALKARGLSLNRADIATAVNAGAAQLIPLLNRLAEKARAPEFPGAPWPAAPSLLLSIDQAEEIFLAEGAGEAQTFLALLKDLVLVGAPNLIVLFTIRSDSYERLQNAKALEGVHQETFSLPPMPRGAYQTIIEGPAQRLKDSKRKLKIEPALTQALLTDIEAGGGKDALPLLAFTLERLYREYGADGDLLVKEYDALDRIGGSIQAAVEAALKAADSDPTIPKDPSARLALLRRALIPALAGIDPETREPRRRVAHLSEIPEEARGLVNCLVEARLLATDSVADTGETIIEPAHEALLRQWDALQGWLKEESAALLMLDGVQQAARDWAAKGRSGDWLSHSAERLEDAERLRQREDFSRFLSPIDREYLATCRKVEAAARGRTRRVRALIYALFVGIITGLLGWINQSYVKEQINWFMTMKPYMLANVRPYVLTADAERALKPLASFRECAKDCPEMIVIPTGEFTMGSPATEKGHNDYEGPQHKVMIVRPFAVSKFDVTFADWDACVSVGGCPQVVDNGKGRGKKPVANVALGDAEQYVAWFSKMTGQPYRLLTEAEWEYAARAGTTTAYFWGDEIGKGNANCDGCSSAWDNRETSPVGSFKPNAFGLYDMAGNVWQWVRDCNHGDYNGAPTDGSEWTGGDCSRRVVRGGSWLFNPQGLRSASRFGDTTGTRTDDLGFRVGRTLSARAGAITVAPSEHY